MDNSNPILTPVVPTIESVVVPVVVPVVAPEVPVAAPEVPVAAPEVRPLRIYTAGMVIRKGEPTCVASYGIYYMHNHKPILLNGKVAAKEYTVTDNGKLVTVDGSYVKPSKERAELLALAVALEAAAGLGDVCIFTTSRYVAKVDNHTTNKDLCVAINSLKKSSSRLEYIHTHHGDVRSENGFGVYISSRAATAAL